MRTHAHMHACSRTARALTHTNTCTHSPMTEKCHQFTTFLPETIIILRQFLLILSLFIYPPKPVFSPRTHRLEASCLLILARTSAFCFVFTGTETSLIKPGHPNCSAFAAKDALRFLSFSRAHNIQQRTWGSRWLTFQVCGTEGTNTGKANRYSHDAPRLQIGL